MRTSKYLLYTLKETPHHAETISHKLMLRAGLIRKLASGLYIWLPNGLRIIKNIKKIIRNCMNQCNAIEICFPILQPNDLWNQSDRFNQYGKELMKVYDRNNNCFILSPTYEEVITDFIKKEITSYKKLPIILYQIQTKFRDEIRPRSGTMRSREFIMKDAYSFHCNENSLKKTYNKMYETYINIFNKMHLNFYSVQANSGIMGGKYSHEFQALSICGENKILVTKNINNTNNKNIHTHFQHNIKNITSITNKKNTPNIQNCIEIGHIFQIGRKYSKIINAKISNETGCKKYIYMGCYGIGITRIISAIIEQHHDAKGIIWPNNLAPFQVIILPIQLYKSEKIKQIAEKLYQQFKKENIEVLLEDRNERVGVIFSDANLIGIPNIIIINNDTIHSHTVEYQERKTIQSKTIIHIKDIIKYVINKIKKNS